MKNRMDTPRSRILQARQTVKELHGLVEELDPLIIRLAALAFFLLAVMRMFGAH